MDEYIKREDAMKALDDYRISHTMSMNGDMELLIEFRYGVVGAMNALAFVPTADVVPKSEVKALQEALSKAEADVKNYMKVAEYQQSLSVKRYHEIKRLKEDVERLKYINERDVENIRLAKAEVARKIFEEMIELLSMRMGIKEVIAELKKKYTEGEND